MSSIMTNQEILRRTANGTEEENRRNRRDPPGNTRKKGRTKVVATVGKQEHTPQAEIARHMENSA